MGLIGKELNLKMCKNIRRMSKLQLWQWKVSRL